MDVHEALQELKEAEIIVVEGKRDKRALARLGIQQVVTLKKPLFEVCEELADYDTVVILTDLDRKGKELYGRLKKGLDRLGVKTDDRFREFLFRETELAHIEGLVTYLRH